MIQFNCNTKRCRNNRGKLVATITAVALGTTSITTTPLTMCNAFTTGHLPIGNSRASSTTNFIIKRSNNIPFTFVQPMQHRTKHLYQQQPEQLTDVVTAEKTDEKVKNEELDQILSSISKNNNTTTTTLQQAIVFLRENPNIQLSRSNWDNIFNNIEEVTAEENMVMLENSAATAGTQLMTGPARQDMVNMYNVLEKRNELKLYGAANKYGLPALGLKDDNVVTPELLQEILNIPISALTPSPTNSVLIAGILVAVIEIGISITTGISVNALVLLTLLFAFFDRLFINGAILETFLKLFNPGIQQKILRHEAGHFLLAYLLGCPVEGIVLSAWGALKDNRFGSRQVSAGTSFFDPILSKQINEFNGQVTRASIDRYCIIVMAGIAAEANYYGQADGGASDELALVSFLQQFGWNSDKIKHQARWSALQAVLLIRQYQPAYDALVNTLECGNSTLGDCIYAIENAIRKNNINTSPMGYITKDEIGMSKWVTNIQPTDNNKQEKLNGSNSNDNNNNIPSSSNNNNKSFSLNPEESLQTLQQYRTQIEEKLRDVENKLKNYE